MIVAALAAVALAGSPELADGWTLWRTERPDAAAALAADRLRADPDDVGAHALYITSWAESLGEPDDVM